MLLYWSIGDRIRRDILLEKRAEYGEQIVPALSAQLVGEYGLGYAEKNLRRMVQFSEVFPDRDIVVTLSRQLGWSHFIALIPIKDLLQTGNERRTFHLLLDVFRHTCKLKTPFERVKQRRWHLLIRRQVWCAH